MPRLFNTTFNYKDATYSAIVTISNYDKEKKVSIEFSDRSLDNILPGGKITLDGQTGLQTGLSVFPVDSNFLEIVWKAVELNEKDKPERDLWS